MLGKLNSAMRLFLFFILLSICASGSSPLIRQGLAAEEGLVIRKFNVILDRKSRSQRVYLFSQDLDKDPELSNRGKIILIKGASLPIMAFRVLRSYGAKNQFAAKALKHYRHGNPLSGDTFLAIEKI